MDLAQPKGVCAPQNGFGPAPRGWGRASGLSPPKAIFLGGFGKLTSCVVASAVRLAE